MSIHGDVSQLVCPTLSAHNYQQFGLLQGIKIVSIWQIHPRVWTHSIFDVLFKAKKCQLYPLDTIFNEHIREFAELNI